MKITFNLQIVKDKPKKDGTWPVYIRVTQNKKMKYVKTGVSIDNVNHFDKDAKYGRWISSKNPLSKSLNQQLENVLNDLKNTFNDLEEQTGQVSSTVLVKTHKTGGNTLNMFEYVDQMIERFKAKEQFRTAEQHTSAFKRLEYHLKGRTFFFSELTVDFLKQYETHLLNGDKNYPKLKQSSVYHQMKHLRSVYYKAVKEQKIGQDNNPFLIFSISKGQPGRKEALNKVEIEKIEQLVYEPGTRKFNVKNSFLFQYYTGGTRVSDLIQLTWAHVASGRVIFEQTKTSHTVNNPITPKAQAILNIYGGKKVKKTDFIFPYLSNSVDYSDTLFLYDQISAKTTLINKTLKLIAKDAEIDKTLTTHVSRHSFASVSNSKGIQLTSISKALGHKNTKVTEVYLDQLDTSIQDKAFTDL